MGTSGARNPTHTVQAQKIALDDVMVVPLGVMPKVQAVRANVEHFVPFYNPRLYNVWLNK